MDQPPPPSTAAAAAAAAAAAGASAAAAAGSDSSIAVATLNPSQFLAAHELFLQQYSWVLLALERTSSSLDGAHRAVRARVAAARARKQSEAASSESTLANLQAKAHVLVKHGVQGMASEGALLGGKDAAATKASLSDPQRRPHQLISAGAALYLALKRVMEQDVSAEWLSMLAPGLLHALAPAHMEHATQHAHITESLAKLQQLFADAERDQ